MQGFHLAWEKLKLWYSISFSIFQFRLTSAGLRNWQATLLNANQFEAVALSFYSFVIFPELGTATKLLNYKGNSCRIITPWKKKGRNNTCKIERVWRDKLHVAYPVWATIYRPIRPTQTRCDLRALHYIVCCNEEAVDVSFLFYSLNKDKVRGSDTTLGNHP